MNTNVSTEVISIGKYIAAIEGRVEYLEKLVKAFYTGDIPEDSTLEIAIFAQAGRVRNSKKVPKLLDTTI